MVASRSSSSPLVLGKIADALISAERRPSPTHRIAGLPASSLTKVDLPLPLAPEQRDPVVGHRAAGRGWDRIGLPGRSRPRRCPGSIGGGDSGSGEGNP